MARSYWLDIGLLVVFSALMSLTGVAFALASRKLIDTAMGAASAPIIQGNTFFNKFKLVACWNCIGAYYCSANKCSSVIWRY